MPNQVSFEQFIGEKIILFIAKTQFSVVLRGVESGGLWVESQEVTDSLLRAAGVTAAPTTPVAFVPFAQIAFAFRNLPAPSLSSRLLEP